MLSANHTNLGPVVQNFVSLTSSLSPQLFKLMLTTYANTLLFSVDKMLESFAVQRILTFYQQKITVYL